MQASALPSPAPAFGGFPPHHLHTGSPLSPPPRPVSLVLRPGEEGHGDAHTGGKVEEGRSQTGMHRRGVQEAWKKKVMMLLGLVDFTASDNLGTGIFCLVPHIRTKMLHPSGHQAERGPLILY